MAIDKETYSEEGKATEVDTIQYSAKEEPKKDYVPDGFDTVEEYLADMRNEYQLDIDFDRENRDDALDDKRFAAGEQWDPVVLAHRKGLPNLVINSVPQFTAQLVGDWRTNRNAIKVVPAEDGDTDVASVRQDLMRAIQMESRADRVYDSAFESMVQCGDGAFRVSVEYARDDVFDQNVCIRTIDDALSTVWDRMSIDPTGRDARHVFVDDTIPKKEFEKKWGNIDPSTLNEEYNNTIRLGGWYSEAGVRVTEHWRMIEREKLLVLFPDGTQFAVEEEDLDALIAKHGEPVKTRISPCSYAQMHLVTGFKILAGPFEYKVNRVPIIRMTGRVVSLAGRRLRYGLVRFMKDPVRLRNFWRSVNAEQLGYAPKAQWIAPESAVEGREKVFREAHLSRDPLIVYNDGAEAPPQRVDPPAMQAALIQESAQNTQDMKDVTGIQDASLGIRSNETSGKAIMARQREGDIANLTYHDNGNAALLEAGDVINQLIPYIYDGTRTIRIIGEDEAVKFIRINDEQDPNAVNLATGKYDVALTTGVSYTTRRVEAAEAMMGAIQVYPELMQIAGDLIVKAQDWPGADKLAERLKKSIPPQLLGEDEEGGQPQVDPAQLQAMAAQAEQAMQQMAEEIKTLKAGHDIDMMKVRIDDYNAKTARIKALSDHEVDNNDMSLKAIQAILGHEASEKDREVKATQKTQAQSAKTTSAEKPAK